MELSKAEAVSVVLVEERELFREGLRLVLEGAGFAVRGEYDSAGAALAGEVEGGKLEPGTVVFCSLSLDGWQEVVHRLLLQAPECAILGMADEVTDEVAIRALSNGIVYCMERALPPEQWVESIRDLNAGKLSPAVALLQHSAAARHALMLLPQTPAPSQMSSLLPALGHRERLALGHIAEGVSLEEAAESMGIAQGALHRLLESVCRKVVERQRLSDLLEQLR